MKFFFDRNISAHLARMMHHFDRENTIIHQDDDARFDDDDEDAFIIQTVGMETPKPIWVTADISQKSNPVERIALRDSGMHVLFFKRFHKAASLHFQAMKILGIWPSFLALVSKARAPTAFEVPSGSWASDKIDVLGPTSSFFS